MYIRNNLILNKNLKINNSFQTFYDKYKKNNKLFVYAVNSFYSVGLKRALIICKAFNFNLFIRCFDLLESDWVRIKNYIVNNFGVKSVIVREEARNVDKLKRLRVYKGLRHSLFLPVRGQRSHTNAQTQKNKRSRRSKRSYRRK